MVIHKISRRLLFITPIIVFLFFSASLSVQSQPCLDGEGPLEIGQTRCDDFGLGDAAAGTGLRANVEFVISDIIIGVLSFVGVIFLILIIYGGIMWMTSGGNETRVGTAKKILTTATVGLIIIMLGYAITFFVVETLTGQIRSQDTTNTLP